MRVDVFILRRRQLARRSLAVYSVVSYNHLREAVGLARVALNVFITVSQDRD